MEKNYTVLICILQFLFLNQRTFASHAAGAEITYHHLNGLTYVVTYSFYRDCFGIPAPTTVDLNLNSASCGFGTTIYTMNPVGNPVEITLPCTGTVTTCNGGLNTGIQKYVYEIQLTLTARCTDWVFWAEISARSSAITTLQTPDSRDLYVEAILD